MADASKKKDFAWQHGFLVDPSDRNAIQCLHCNKVTKGGIYRHKQHLLGGNRNVKMCLACPAAVRQQLMEIEEKKKKQKSKMDYQLPDLNGFEEDDEEEDLEAQPLNRKRGSSSQGSCSQAQAALIPKPKKAKGKGPIHSYFQKKPETVVEERKRQTSILEGVDKQRRAATIQYIAKFFYQAGNAFNQVKLDSFKHMVEAIGQYGPNLKPPSYHEMRVTMLNKEVAHTRELLKEHEKMWAIEGCSIMSDGWTSRTGQTIINFLVNSRMGSAFVESVDASGYSKTGEKTFQLLDSFVEKIGEENVIQVITDNGSNFKMAGKLLEAKRQHLYWTPCAAHCIDLMLEDIGKLKIAAKTIKAASFLTRFIYNHQATLNLMRKMTNGRNLVRPAITRFATNYLCLKSIQQQRNALRQMVVSEEWNESAWSRDSKAKEVKATILKPSFWNNTLWILKMMGPLVRVLRLVDNEQKPAMGYLYEAMDRAKEAIKEGFKGKVDKFKDAFKIIDERWGDQLHKPLHAAAHYLNPEYFYANPSIQSDEEVMKGLYDCIEKLVRGVDERAAILNELSAYRDAKGLFGGQLAIQSRDTKAPADWWACFGATAPNLQRLAIKILNLTCSASGCERNWSVFEQIHSPRRNKLLAKTLNNLVFVKYNQALKARYESLRAGGDKIALDDIDYNNEWLEDFVEGDDDDAANDPYVFSDDEGGIGLTYGLIAEASGAEEPVRQTRKSRLVDSSAGPSTVGARKSKTNSKKSKNKGVSFSIRDDFEETEAEEYETDEEEIYKSENEDEEDDVDFCGVEDDGDY